MFFRCPQNACMTDTPCQFHPVTINGELLKINSESRADSLLITYDNSCLQYAKGCCGIPQFKDILLFNI